jgi:hypothetical protein
MPVAQFSDKVLKMWETLKPYIGFPGGLKDDAPPEIKELYKEYRKQVLKEAWLD